MKKKTKKGELVKQIQQKLSAEYKPEIKTKKTKVYKIVLPKSEKYQHRTFDVDSVYFTNKKYAHKFAQHHKLICYKLKKSIYLIPQ